MVDNPADKTGVNPERDVQTGNPVSAASADVVEDVPDPDEDDLDDLDDMLEDFSALKTDSAKPSVHSGPGRPAATDGAADRGPTATTEPSLEEVLSDDDFAKQLQAGMAEMLGGIQDSAEMQSEFEKIFRDIAAAAAEAGDGGDLPTAPDAPKTAGPSAPASAPASSSTAAPTFGNPKDADFAETIRRTMERMQASGDQATAAAAEAGSDDLLADLLKTMGAAGGAEGSEEEFSKLLLGMMEQLTNKDILYEPMKELNDKFPEWMVKNRSKVSAEDMKRYEEQQALAAEIVAKFEEPTFSDANPKDREYIVDRMQKMQAAGSPPPDLVGDMPSAQDAFGGMNPPGDESCNPQ